MRTTLTPRRARFVTVLLFSGLLVASVGLVVAQDTLDTTPRPAHVHEGTCDDLDPNPAYPLNDVTFRFDDDDDDDDDDNGGLAGPGEFVGDANAVPVAYSETEIGVGLDTLLGAPHAINVHESAENPENYIACGEIGGFFVDDDDLFMGLREQNASGFTGVAILEDDDDDDEVEVKIYLAQTGGSSIQFTEVGDDTDTEPVGDTVTRIDNDDNDDPDDG